MIHSPTIAEVLRGISHAMSTTLKKGLDNPVKLAMIDTMVGVLTATAVRAEQETRIVGEETAVILAVARAIVADGSAPAALADAVEAYDDGTGELTRYEQASRILSVLGDLGAALLPPHYEAVRALMTRRLENEQLIIGGGFEAAGRN